MTATPAFITSDRVADMLGLPDGAAFLRQRARLEEDCLFPLPMPTSRRPMRWRADAVAAWVDRQGQPAAPGIPPELIRMGKVALLDMARTA